MGSPGGGAVVWMVGQAMGAVRSPVGSPGRCSAGRSLGSPSVEAAIGPGGDADVVSNALCGVDEGECRRQRERTRQSRGGICYIMDDGPRVFPSPSTRRAAGSTSPPLPSHPLPSPPLPFPGSNGGPGLSRWSRIEPTSSLPASSRDSIVSAPASRVRVNRAGPCSAPCSFPVASRLSSHGPALHRRSRPVGRSSFSRCGCCGGSLSSSLGQ